MRNRVVRAAKLERAHALEVFAFEKDRRASALVRRAGRKNRRAVRDAVDTRGGVDHIIVSRNGKRLHRRKSAQLVARTIIVPASTMFWKARRQRRPFLLRQKLRTSEKRRSVASSPRCAVMAKRIQPQPARCITNDARRAAGQ